MVLLLFVKGNFMLIILLLQKIILSLFAKGNLEMVLLLFVKGNFMLIILLLQKIILSLFAKGNLEMVLLLFPKLRITSPAV